jgi:hypothetical protein
VAAKQFQTGVPVVVPASFAFEGIDAGRCWSPAAVVLHGGLEGFPITARDITDHSIDVEQQQLAGGRVPVQEVGFWRLVG